MYCCLSNIKAILLTLLSQKQFNHNFVNIEVSTYLLNHILVAIRYIKSKALLLPTIFFRNYTAFILQNKLLD